MTSLTGGAPNTGHHHSPPISPPQHPSSLYPPSYGPASNNDASAQHASPTHGYSNSQEKVLGLSASALPASNHIEDVPAKPRKGRKKAVAEEGTKADSDGKQKRQRKLKDPNAPPPPPRKRVKKEENPPKTSVGAKASEYSAMYPPSSAASSTPVVPSSAVPSREHASLVTPQADQFRAPPRPQSSGQRYDPVRGVSVDIPSERPSSSNAYGPVGLKSPVRQSHSIASLIDHSPSSTHAPSPSVPPRSTPSTVYTSVPNGVASSSNPKSSVPSTLKMTDSPAARETLLSSTKKVDSPQRKPSPKGAKAKDKEVQPPPPLPGSHPSAQLTNGDMGKPINREKKYEEVPNDCIVIDVPIKKDENGNYINFLREVESKYGFDVAHPRLAEHRRRMKEVAAAGAALESVPGSADEMNLDVSEPDTDAEMDGKNEGSNSEGAKKSRKVNEKYNLDDDFIDDSEMIFEEQALASKDGYFVWSGPLIREGEKPTIERADGTVKRGPRGGRGGARGGATRGETKTRGTRGGGPGSRGGQTVRKPRVTKADRARMEAEKAEREKMGSSAAKPVLYPGTM